MYNFPIFNESLILWDQCVYVIITVIITENEINIVDSNRNHSLIQGLSIRRKEILSNSWELFLVV